ncbi:MAG: MerR family transcriptional regulator [Bacilli bacterium]|nr:MerR family transcriptional regulator [Bacilli bacterium]
MYYSIGEISEMFNLPIPTLRFYDKEGLLLDLERDASGIRKFNEKTIEALRVIECLKKSGMQIKEIKEFMHWCSLGDKTILKRKEMFLTQKENIEQEIKELEKALNMIKYKCWYYEEALKDGTEKRVKNITPNQMPNEVKEYYDKAHE